MDKDHITVRKYITLKTMKSWQESIAFLDNYEPIEGQIDHVGPDINSIIVGPTKLLEELGRINKRRKEIIEKLKNYIEN